MSFNLWNHKPWWCQPWSILLTGIIVISGTWWLSFNIFLTVIMAAIIFAWWFYFLILYPRLVEKMIKAESEIKSE